MKDIRNNPSINKVMMHSNLSKVFHGKLQRTEITIPLSNMPLSNSNLMTHATNSPHYNYTVPVHIFHEQKYCNVVDPKSFSFILFLCHNMPWGYAALAYFSDTSYDLIQMTRPTTIRKC